MRIVQISDTHFCRSGGATTENFECVAEYVNDSLRPDLIVHTGDNVLLFPDDIDDRAASQASLGKLEAPLLVLPGNHDVGEPGPTPWAGIGITSERVEAQRTAFGPDRFLETFEDWAVIGLNSELLDSGLPEEDEQWAWLDRTAVTAPERVVLFLHKPLWMPDGKAAEVATKISDESRERVLELFGDRLRAVGSGHLHMHRETQRDGLLEVWAPSTAFTVSLPSMPANSLGVLEWEIGSDGVKVTMHTPPGLEACNPLDVPELMEGLARVSPETLEMLTAGAHA